MTKTHNDSVLSKTELYFLPVCQNQTIQGWCGDSFLCSHSVAWAPSVLLLNSFPRALSQS